MMKKKILLTAVTLTIAFSSSLTASAASLKNCFDAGYYASQYDDVKKAFGNNAKAMYKHYLKYGISEGRKCNPYFDVKAYRERYADLDVAFGDNWDAYYNHYITYGLKEKRNATTNGTAFDALLYADKYPDLKRAFGDDVEALFNHFIQYGISEGRTYTTDSTQNVGTPVQPVNPKPVQPEDPTPDQPEDPDPVQPEDPTPDQPDDPIPDQPEDPDFELSIAEEYFLNNYGNQLKESTDEIPYAMTYPGEGWWACLEFYCDKNDKPQYVVMCRDAGEGNSVNDEYNYYYLDAMTYEVYTEWIEGYKQWVLINDYNYNPMFMLNIMYPLKITHSDGTEEFLSIPQYEQGWRFENE